MLSRIFALVVAALTPGSYSSESDFQDGMEILKDLLLENAVPQHGQTEDHLHQIFQEIRGGICKVHTTEGPSFSVVYVYIFDEIFPNLIISHLKENCFRDESVKYEIV